MPRWPITSLTQDKFKEEYLKHGSLRAMADYLGMSRDKVAYLAEKYHIPLAKLHHERNHQKILDDYNKLVTLLGRHPSYTDIVETVGNPFYERISKYYGNLAKFQKAHGYPVSKKVYIPKHKIKKSRSTRKHILRALTLKEELSVPEIITLLGIGHEAARRNLLKLAKKGIVGLRKTHHRHYFYLINPEKYRDPTPLTIGDLKPNILSEYKVFIDEFCRLYMRLLHISDVASTMKIEKNDLLNRLDLMIKKGYLAPLTRRRSLILALRIKKDYDTIERADIVAKFYGLSASVAHKYLTYGDSAGIFKYTKPDTKVKPRDIPKKEDLYSKRNLAIMKSIKKDYDSLGTMKEVSQKYHMPPTKIWQILTDASDFGLFEFPKRKKH